ncbi:MAG: T9SS type A sorting domain-containing protein, partial [Chitinophagales bacterium]|nr:T9SS type A sorting domain-containing protein [Chitinophagales bacterium]
GYFRIPYSVTEVERLGALDNSFAIYPNPNSNYFMIINLNKGLIINPEYKVELYSMTGNLVLETTFLEGRSINIESLPVGVYNVLIYTNNELSGSETLVKMQ